MSRRAVARPDPFSHPPLSIDYDRNSGIVIIEGIRYHESVFKNFARMRGLYQIKCDAGCLSMQEVEAGAGTCLLCGKGYKELAKHAKTCRE